MGWLRYFFLEENVAVVTLVATFVGSIVGSVLVEVQGFTKLLGLMHTPWVPAVALQLLVLLKGQPHGNFRLWLMTSFSISCISLLIDAYDIFVFMKGNRVDLLEKANV